MKVLCATLAFGLVLFLQAQARGDESRLTSENNDRLETALERFPAADANRDGVLTLAEAKAFKEEKAGQQDRRGLKPARAPEGGQRHIYKRVGDVELPLYVFKPSGHKTSAKTPAIVFFFGGGWKSGSPAQYEQQCKDLSKRGMVAITVEYRVGSRHKAKIEDCVEDAKTAMRWVCGHAADLGIDPNRIASSGGSAGGHLAACVSIIDGFDSKADNLKISPKPNAMVLFNPALARAPHERLPAEANTILRALLREDGTRERTRAPAVKSSPLQYAAMKQPPCIMLYGTEDRLLVGAETYRDISVEAGNHCKIITYEGQGHVFFNFADSILKSATEKKEEGIQSALDAKRSQSWRLITSGF